MIRSWQAASVGTGDLVSAHDVPFLTEVRAESVTRTRLGFRGKANPLLKGLAWHYSRKL